MSSGNEQYPIFAGEVMFTDAHQAILHMNGDVAPIDVTRMAGMNLVEGRVAIGATVQPPTVWQETTTYSRGECGVAEASHLRTTFRLQDGEVVAEHRAYSGQVIDGRTQTEHSFGSFLAGKERRVAFNAMLGLVQRLQDTEPVQPQ